MARSHEDFVDIVKIKNPSVEIVGIYTKAQDRIAVKCKECGYSYKDSYTDALQKSTEPDIKHIINNTNKDISNTAINNTYVNATAIKSVNSGKKSIKIKWKKVSGVSGYQLQYATNKSFKKGKKITIKSNSTTVRTIRKLKNKKKYYVIVRGYKKVKKGKRYIPEFSPVNKLTITI